MTTVSTVLSAREIAVADPCRNSARTPAATARNRKQTGRRVDPEDDLYLFAIEREVQSRSNTDFEHPSIGSGNDLAAILFKLPLPHREIEDSWEYPAVIEIHDSLSASQ